MHRTTSGIDAPSIGERLRLTREILGLSQAEFADRCVIARNTYNQYEQGRNIPQLQQAVRLSEVYQLSLDWIYRGDPSGLPFRLADAIRAARLG
jgi:transcriptional regulator with XRE-family HTH domain